MNSTKAFKDAAGEVEGEIINIIRRTADMAERLRLRPGLSGPSP
ncbi:MAG TPA: hypothetical protein VHB73_07470 [Alphaproteobacteria bacterium]|nr:hypothetical protein [Alphaproteobacteria bacterium]